MVDSIQLWPKSKCFYHFKFAFIAIGLSVGATDWFVLLSADLVAGTWGRTLKYIGFETKTEKKGKSMAIVITF